MENNTVQITPVAHIYTDFKEKFGIPRQSGLSPSSIGKIVFEPRYANPDAIRGIEGFSHLWLVFDFSECHTSSRALTVRPPRLGGNTRVGVFASRSPFRPNSIGLSSVKLVKTETSEHDGIVLWVAGADLLDGTPIFDIKPYLPYSDCHADAVGGYAAEHEQHRLEVVIPPNLLDGIARDKRAALIECLEGDPRPSYIDDEERIFNMRFADYDIHFRVSGKKLIVVGSDVCQSK